MQKLVLSILNFYKFGLASLNSVIDLEEDYSSALNMPHLFNGYFFGISSPGVTNADFEYSAFSTDLLLCISLLILSSNGYGSLMPIWCITNV